MNDFRRCTQLNGNYIEADPSLPVRLGNIPVSTTNHLPGFFLIDGLLRISPSPFTPPGFYLHKND